MISKRSRLRQYPTPTAVVEMMYHHRVKKEIGTEAPIVFDPAVGTGTTLAIGKRYIPNALFVGWDIDDEILEKANEITDGINIALEHKTILLTTPPGKAHLIITEPPYGWADKAEYKHKYSNYISGRANLIVGFMLETLKSLHRKGEMIVLLPVTALTGPAFNLLRRAFDNAYINRIHIVDDSYFDRSVNVPMAIVSISHEPLISEEDAEKYRVSVNRGKEFEQVLWTAEAKKLKDYLATHDTLDDLGYKVTSGPFMWDRNKDRLRLRMTEGAVRILWPHTIEQGKFSNKPDYAMIGDEKLLKGPAIVTKRTIGRNFKPHFMLVEEGETYLAENHVLVIRPTKNTEMSVEELYRTLEDSYYIETYFDQGEKVQAVNAMTPQLRIVCPNGILSPRHLQYMIGVVQKDDYDYEAKHSSV